MNKRFYMGLRIYVSYFFIMKNIAPSQKYHKSILKNALIWLKSQNIEWKDYVKDTNIVVRLYLQEKKNKKMKHIEDFKSELEKIYKKEKSCNFTTKSIETNINKNDFDLEKANNNKKNIPFCNNNPILNEKAEEEKEEYEIDLFSLLTTHEKKEETNSIEKNNQSSVKNSELSETNKQSSLKIGNLDNPSSKDSFLSSEKRNHLIDEISEKTIEKAKKKLNLENNEDALKVLIQFGYQSLKSFFK